MSSTRARRFIAAYSKASRRKTIPFFALFVCTCLFGADCPQQNLSPQERLGRVRDLDLAGQSAMAAGQFTRAVQNFREAACLAPRSSRVLYGLGVAEAASGDLLNARVSLREADRLQPTSALPLVMQVRVNLSLQDTEALKSNLRDAAIRFPNDGAMHAGLARFLAEKKEFVLGVAESLRAKQAGGGDSSSQVELAGLENTMGAYSDAIRSALAIENQTGLPETVRAAAAGIAGLSYASLGQQEEAMQHMQQAIRHDPSRENSYLALAELLEKAQRYGEAVQVLEDGRRAAQNSTALLLPLGVNLVRAERFQEGIMLLRDLLKRSPDEDQAYLNIADASRKLADAAAELQVLRDLARRKPDYLLIHVLIARALLNVNAVDYGQVLKELAEAEKAAPSDADLFYLRGKAYVATNREEDAVAAFRRSIELRPMEPGAYYQLGRLYQKLGRPELATQQMQRLKYMETARAR
jgi:tetratricopeptide (TPR) repeat protein